MSFREYYNKRGAHGIAWEHAGEISRNKELTLLNSECPCVCRELLTVILDGTDGNIIKDIAYRIGNEGLYYYLGLLSGAHFCLEQGENTMGSAFMDNAMAAERKHDYMTMIFCWLPSVMAALCKRALEAGIEVEYVQNFIRSYNLFPEKPLFDIGEWPWPVKIHTLGRFELALDGNSVLFSGKVRRKPLQMLKALIALGGKQVNEEQLTDLLWPEADGDQAHSAFSTTLSRLRSFIGYDKAIEIHGGKASLNPRYCWVDAWAFEEICGQVHLLLEGIGETGSRENRESENIIQLAERAISMYGGTFLPDEGNQSWVLPLRERLKNRFIKLITMFGNHLESIEKWEKAAEYYQMTLDLDEIADEEFYQKLMICHHRLNQPVRAFEVYRRCSKTLAASLGLKPSPKTEIIYKNLCLDMETANA
jgi:DNA-binding SARP family transcriptional activator